MSSSSSSSVSYSTVNGVTRVTGLSSGIDVDSIVEELMTSEKAKKLNKLEQQEQLAEWKQTAYRDIISDIQTFTSKYFDTTSSTSLLSEANFKQYSVTSSSSAVTASYTSAASAGSHTVSVSQLATAATLKSSASISADVQGAAAPDYSELAGTSFVITLDGTDYTVSFDSSADYSDYTVSDLQTAVDEAVGSGKLTVSATEDGYLTITAADSGVDEISVSAPSSSSTSSALSALGLSADGAVLSNRADTADTLSTLFDSTVFNSEGKIVLTINGTSFSFDSDDTLDTMMNEINDSSCGATLSYDELTGKLVLTATATGAGNTLAVTEPDDATAGASSFVSTYLTASTQGTDAVATVDGQTITRSSNTFTVDGVKYTLNDTTTDSSGTATKATVSLSLDTDGIYELISDFVTDYNSLIDTINSEIDEDYDSDYPPLTDDQKDEMTDDEIEQWEEKAKTGILENDSLLKGFLSDLRSIFLTSSSSSSTTIFDIGIDTGTYDQKGKLIIDEDALKEAIEADPDKIMNLFTQQSSSYSGLTSARKLNSTALTTRYNEEGIGYRFYDAIAKYTSTIRDSSGNKGLLLEKAGAEEDSSESDNTLSDEIADYEDKISDEEDRLDDYEDKLYDKYTTLETYINTMNSQLSALQSYLSS